MGSHLNLIGSILIGGIVLLMINRFHSSMVDDSYTKNLDSITNYNCNEIAHLIEFDFTRLGLGVPSGTSPLVAIDTSQISFLSDIDENGTIDLVRYTLSNTNLALDTENPRDRILFRILNGQQPSDPPQGVTRFRIRYFNAIGNETNVIAQIRTIEVSLTIESTLSYNNHFANSQWQMRISPPCLM